MGSGSSSPRNPEQDELRDSPWELLTYCPPYGNDFEFSHTHFLYTHADDIPTLEDLPPPHTAPTRKNEVFDPEAYSQVDERTDAVKHEALERPITDLVKLLTGDYDDDISKVRAIYRWITSQAIATTEYKKNAKTNTAMYHLWNLKDKRNTYAGLFSVLCGHANLPCAIIRGYLKGSTYDVGQKIDKETHRGEWNAVLVDGNWRFVNAFWGACVQTEEDGYEDYVYTCDENFFLTDPMQLIYTHFPEDENWQLLDNKKTIEDFETMVFLKDRFFNLEMRVLSHPYCNTRSVNGEIDILFGLHPDKSVNHTFLCVATFFVDQKKGNRTKPVHLPNQNVQLDFIHRSNENVLSVKVRFPEVGVYKLEIVGKDITVVAPDYDFDWVAIYKVHVDSVPEEQTLFPVADEAGWGPGKYLTDLGLAPFSHPSGEINMVPGPVEVKFKIIDPEKFERAQGNLTYTVTRTGEGKDEGTEHHNFTRKGDVISASFNLSEGEFKMAASVNLGDGHQRTFNNYRIVSESPTHKEHEQGADKGKPKEPDECEVLRENLRGAINSQKLDELERAVDLVESKGYAHRLAGELREAKDLIARLRRLQKLIHEVMTLNQRTIAEIKSYNNPISEIHTCMRATLLLLGHSEEETKDWRNVQALIGKTGKMSLKRRIQELDVNKLNEKTVQKTKDLLKDIKLEDVVIISAGATTFYTWASGIVEEFEVRKKQ